MAPAAQHKNLLASTRPRLPPEVSLTRAAFAAYVAKSGVALTRSPEYVAEKLWPSDRVAHALTRAAISGASTDDDAWAGTLAADAVGGFFGSLTPSAGAQLIAAGARVSLAGQSSIAFPGRTTQPAALPWVGEGEPIAVRQSTLAGRTMGPAKKMAVISVMSRELARSSSAEAVFAQVFREDAATSLDAAIFNNAAATDDNPAGLLNGVTPLTASAGGDPMAEDLEALAGEVAAGGGSGRIAFVAHPRQAAAIMIRRPDITAAVWSSSALVAGTVVALDPTGFVSAFGGEPDIEASESALLHMSDTPEHIGTVGSPNTVAAPVQSMFQTGQVAVRVIAEAAFAMRSAGLVAVVEGVSW